MNYTFCFHADIEKDYLEAYTWYEKKQKGLGERFFTMVRMKLEQIGNNPEAPLLPFRF
jgi:hypothetical protein